MFVQIIGLPGSGKTTAIKEFLAEYNQCIYWLDIRNVTALQREKQFRMECQQVKWDLIAESACGIPLKSSYIVHLNIDPYIAWQRCQSRGDDVSLHYLYDLRTQIMRADRIVDTPEQLTAALHELIGGRDAIRGAGSAQC